MINHLLSPMLIVSGGWGRFLSQLLFIQVLLTIPIKALGMDNPTITPDFDAMVGHGRLALTDTEGSVSVTTASFNVIPELSIAGNERCRGLWLPEDKSIVVVARCPSGVMRIFMSFGRT